MQDNVSKIKDRLDVVEVIGSYMKLQKAGINYKGRCPFHNEKTPSFFVSPERQIWHCFGCAKGGDMFEFVKEIEGVEFPEAMKVLAARAGVQLETFTREASLQRDAKTRLYEVCELATKFFKKQFESTTGKKALQYLRDRGMADETIKEFRLGFAPKDWESLAGYLRTCGYADQEIVDAGMAIRSEKKQGIYDRFRSRIMFPITDISGQVVGFSGRVFALAAEVSAKEASGSQNLQTQPVDKGVDQTDHVVAKYVNTPQTLIYDKSRVLYGLSQAKLDIKKADQCILVEGNMDALMSYQAGVRNVVASSGTALTPHHLRLLQRYTKNLGFCFDTDQAGAMATKRGIGLALAQQFNIKVLAIEDKECKDPADFVQKYGPRWSELVAAAKPVVDYYFDKARLAYNPTKAESGKAVLASVAPFVKRLASNVERSHWISQLAALLRVPEQAVIADLQNIKDDFVVYDNSEGGGRSEQSQSEAPSKLAPDLLNEAILSVVLKNPAVARESGIPHDLLDARTSAVIRHISDRNEPFEFSALISSFPETAMHLEFANLRAQELWNELDEEELAFEFRRLLNMARKRALTTRLVALQFDLKEAEANQQRERVATLAAEFNDIARQLTIINRHGEEKNEEATKKAGGGQETETIRQPTAKESSQAG